MRNPRDFRANLKIDTLELSAKAQQSLHLDAPTLEWQPVLDLLTGQRKPQRFRRDREWLREIVGARNDFAVGADTIDTAVLE